MMRFFIVICSFVATAYANGVTNPKDAVAQRFVIAATSILQRLQAQPSASPLTSSEMLQLAQLLQDTSVESLNENLYDRFGLRVDARTMPHPTRPGKKLIQLDRAKWSQYFLMGTSIQRLVFHEYLWALGKDDTNYMLSQKLENSEVPPDIYNGKYLAFELNPCGQKGSLLQRLNDCAKPLEQGGNGAYARRVYRNSKPDPLDPPENNLAYEWMLVTTTDDFLEFWLDVSGGIVWGPNSWQVDFLKMLISFQQAKSICAGSDRNSKDYTIDLGPQTSAWRLPSAEMFLSSSVSRGLAVVTTSEVHFHWTADESATDPDLAMIFDEDAEITSKVLSHEKSLTEMMRCAFSIQ